MSREINLLPKQSQNFLQKEKVFIIVQIVAYGSFILSLTLSLILFFLGQNNDIVRLQSQQKSLETSITLLQNKQLQYMFVSDRISRIQAILKGRNDFSAILQNIEKLIPDSVAIQSLSLDKKTISLIVTSDSLSSMGQFIDLVSSSVKNKKLLKHVTFDNVIANPIKGVYTLSMQGELL